MNGSEAVTGGGMPTSSSKGGAGSPAELIWIGRAADVPMLEGRTVTVGGRRIAVFRTHEGFHALAAVCPHRGGPLADGIVADSCVTCPLHNWRFDLRTGAGVGDHAGVARFEVEVRAGELWLRAPDALQEAA